MKFDRDKSLSEIASELEQAWNTADGERFSGPFTRDADFV
jgi:hypothetical protein